MWIFLSFSTCDSDSASESEQPNDDPQEDVKQQNKKRKKKRSKNKSRGVVSITNRSGEIHTKILMAGLWAFCNRVLVNLLFQSE